MKKYTAYFLLFLGVCMICAAAGYLFTRSQVRREEAIPNVTIETETVTEDRIVLNQDAVKPVGGASGPVLEKPAEQENRKIEEQYYLVAEDGYLLVFCQDKSTVCLYTHMPLMDFPEEEQIKLRAGIWFLNMLDIFNYLESYTS